MDSLRIISINARGLKNKLKRKTIFDYIKACKIDIACIQEAHISSHDAPIWERQWGGKFFWKEGTNHSKGEIIMVSKHLQANFEVLKCEDRILVLLVKTNSFDFILINIYAPNNIKDKILFFEKLQLTLQNFSSDKIVLMGDFNSVIDNDLDIILEIHMIN